jgi:hypothetical protein
MTAFRSRPIEIAGTNGTKTSHRADALTISSFENTRQSVRTEPWSARGVTSGGSFAATRALQGAGASSRSGSGRPRGRLSAPRGSESGIGETTGCTRRIDPRLLRRCRERMRVFAPYRQHQVDQGLGNRAEQMR